MEKLEDVAEDRERKGKLSATTEHVFCGCTIRNILSMLEKKEKY